MSRVGAKRIPIPAGVEVSVGGSEVSVKGPLGSLATPILPGIRVAVADGAVSTTLAEESGNRAFWGLTRALLANAVAGVSKGFRKELDIVGVGYRAQVEGRRVTFALGYSHPISLPLPEGVEVQVEKNTHLVVSGYDKQAVGQLAAQIRALRKPDPYKQKGVRYTGERLIKKAGKTGA